MSSISQCEYNIRKYINLKSNINSILSKLANSIDSAESLNQTLNNKYLINDNYTPIVSRTNKLKNNIESTYTYLNNKVIPAIDSAIYRTKLEIAKLESEEQADIENNG